MTCPHCYQQVPEDSAFCPQCGARLAALDTLTAMEVADDPAYGALAQANLLRMRGEWKSAQEKVVSVLREFSNSAMAHSLMGDIHADQGLYEAAAQWYRMALDLEPDNSADARKLAAAEAQLQPQQTPLPPDVPDAPPPISLFRLAAVTSIVFLAAMIAMGFWFRHVYQPPPTGPFVAAPKSIAPPASLKPGASNPEPLPAIAEPAPSASAPSAPAAPASQPAHTAAETALATQLAEMAPTLQPVGLRLSSVEIDPRDSRVAITLDGSGVNGAAPDWTARTYRVSVELAQRALKNSPEAPDATVRLVMPLARDKTVTQDVAFIGVMPRDGADFAQRWWRPGLTVAPGAGAAAP
ncbi:MAG TPA: tetratricopeptide repeat protein [Armatimonadota bacterium]|jgi:hypothetical protein